MSSLFDPIIIIIICYYYC